jgi:hypothetical protein
MSDVRLGDIVIYCLDATDVEGITSRRVNFQLKNQGRSGHKHPHGRDVHEAPGYVAHIGSPVHVGQECVGVVSLIPDPPRVNLHLLLDGSDPHWVTCVPPGDGPGTWRTRGDTG